MLKWRKYWRSSPDRDEIWVEKYCVPKGTLISVYAPVFYRYHIPNGMLRSECHCGLDPQSPNGMLRSECHCGLDPQSPQKGDTGIRRHDEWAKCPVRDEISVEKRNPACSRRPVGTEYEGYCVPNGTPKLACASVFYQYYIPNGMTAYIRQFIFTLTVFSSVVQ